jgi:8-oxo-dGTP pyrophosphatase MutT (NUDIX family)
MEDLTIFDNSNDTKTSENELIEINNNISKIFNDFDNVKIEYNNKIDELNNKLNDTIQILNKTLIELENFKKNNLKKNNFKQQEKNNKNTENNKNNKNNKNNNKIFKSASLVFIDDELGYLLCNEYRYKEKNTLIHPIGGKTETYDNGLLETAIREFVEETNLEQYSYEYIDKSDKNKLIENIMVIINQDVQFYDLCVSKESGYYHRFYSLNLKNIKQSDMFDEFKKSIIELPKFFNGNFKTEVDSLIWFDVNNNKINLPDNKINFVDKKISHLTKMFFKYKQ